MNMMETDIGGEPRKRLRKEIVRAALHGGSFMTPITCTYPKGLFKLVLHIKQPYTNGSGDKGYRSVDCEKVAPTEPPNHQAPQHSDRQVRRHRANPIVSIRCSIRNAVAKHEQVSRTDPEHHHRMSIKAVFQAPHRSRAKYSLTVRVVMSPMPRRSRLPELA